MPLALPSQVQIDRHIFMVSFDFVECTSRGYKFFWTQRRFIVPLMLMPLAIKLVCFVGITALLDEVNLLRQGLCLLPSYFAEGWLVAQIIRIAVFQEVEIVADPAYQESRKRCVLASMVIYVLIKLAVAFLTGYILMRQGVVLQGLSEGKAQSQPGGGEFILGTVCLVLIIWGFRFLWLYVPAAMGWPVGNFLRRIKPFVASFSFIGSWLLCFIPFSLFLILISQMLLSVFPGSAETVSDVYRYLIIGVQAVLETIMTIIVSVAVAYGIKSIYDGTNKPTPIL